MNWYHTKPCTTEEAVTASRGNTLGKDLGCKLSQEQAFLSQVNTVGVRVLHLTCATGKQALLADSQSRLQPLAGSPALCSSHKTPFAWHLLLSKEQTLLTAGCGLNNTSGALSVTHGAVLLMGLQVICF